MKKIWCVIMALVAVAGVFAMTPQVYATNGINSFADNVNILKDCDSKASGTNGEGVYCILNTVLTIMTFGVGIAGTIGLVVSGILYLTARDNEQQMAKAKKRIIEIAIGLAIWAAMWGIIQFLLPGAVGLS